MTRPDLDERLRRHLERVHGPVAGVWHEIASDQIELDVLIAPPVPADPVTVIMTAGMSTVPMTVPRGVRNRRKQEYAELCMLLPPDWPLPAEARTPPDSEFWPFRVLKTLARRPHDEGSWLAMGHSVTNGEPAQAWADGIPFTGAVLLPAGNDPKTFRVRGRPPTIILQAFLVTSFEMQIMRNEGVLAFVDALEAAGVDAWGPLDIHRATLRRGDL